MRIKKSFLKSAVDTNTINEIIVESGNLIYRFNRRHNQILFGRITSGIDRECGITYYERIYSKSGNVWELLNEPNEEFLKDRGFLTFIDLIGYYKIL